MNVVTLMKTAQFIVCVCYLFLISQWHGLNFVHAQESELIIQFAPGTSPYELQKQVTERKDRENFNSRGYTLLFRKGGGLVC